MIAHCLSTLNHCDVRLELVAGELWPVGRVGPKRFCSQQKYESLRSPVELRGTPRRGVRLN